VIFIIDLTVDEDKSEDESEAREEDDEDDDDEEEDLRMLRRRLRENVCQWEGCVGPALLASAELLGVHLNKKHSPKRDASVSEDVVT
jgi:hypothetical protein